MRLPQALYPHTVTFGGGEIDLFTGQKLAEFETRRYIDSGISIRDQVALEVFVRLVTAGKDFTPTVNADVAFDLAEAFMSERAKRS